MKNLVIGILISFFLAVILILFYESLCSVLDGRALKTCTEVFQLSIAALILSGIAGSLTLLISFKKD